MANLLDVFASIKLVVETAVDKINKNEQRISLLEDMHVRLGHLVKTDDPECPVKPKWHSVGGIGDTVTHRVPTYKCEGDGLLELRISRLEKQYTDLLHGTEEESAWANKGFSDGVTEPLEEVDDNVEHDQPMGRGDG